MNRSHYARGFRPLVVIIIIVALAAGGILVYQTVDITPITPALEPQSDATSSTQASAGSISSFAIIPSMKDGPWTMYKDGAKAVLKAENIMSAEVWQTPTGTEGPGPRFAGTMSKVGVDTWELELPANLLTTSFWAEATDLTGRKIKSADLGNVGYNVDAIDDAAAARFLSKPDGVVQRENGVYIIDWGTAGTMTLRKTLRADFDNDGKQDVVMLLHSCGASCSDHIDVLLNKKDGIIRADNSSSLFAKSIEMSLQGNLIRVDFKNLAGELESSKLVTVKNDTLVFIGE